MAENLKAPILKQRLVDPESLATTIFVIVYDAFGPEFMEWSPGVIRDSVNEEFDIELPDANLGRLMAAVTLVSTDRFYKSLPDFINIANVLSGSLLDPNYFDPADVDECAWAIYEASIIWPQNDIENAFSPEIRGYLGAVCEREGYVDPPDVLRIALPISDKTVDSFPPEAWKLAKQRNDELMQFLKHRLNMLADQLDGLPLANGDSRALVERLRKISKSGLR